MCIVGFLLLGFICFSETESLKQHKLMIGTNVGMMEQSYNLDTNLNMQDINVSFPVYYNFSSKNNVFIGINSTIKLMYLDTENKSALYDFSGSLFAPINNFLFWGFDLPFMRFYNSVNSNNSYNTNKYEFQTFNERLGIFFNFGEYFDISTNRSDGKFISYYYIGIDKDEQNQLIIKQGIKFGFFVLCQ